MAAWFADAVRAEIEELQQKGGEQRFELLSGQRITPDSSSQAVYRFILAETTLVPEDSNGTLEVEGRPFKATVVAQELNRIDLQVEGATALGPFVARALLRVEDLGLLKKLADVLEAIASGRETVTPLSSAMFHPTGREVATVPLPALPELDRVVGEQRSVIEQACGSDITFVWGPPGTGKTYVIAHLIAALTKRGERVLMTSHTHAAVDQSMYETVKPDGGPLAGSDLERNGRIVRLGRVTNSKLPHTVRLDSIVERKGQVIQEELTETLRRASRLSEQADRLRSDLAEWHRLHELRARLGESERRVTGATAEARRRSIEQQEASGGVESGRELINKAEQAWFFRASKSRQAREALSRAERALAIALGAAAQGTGALREAERAAESLRLEAGHQSESCARLCDAELLRRELAPLDAELERIQHRCAELRAQLDALERLIISDARVVGATLTKCYVGEQLSGQSFDALIVDEISMALPPLLFVAARRVFRRVILVGDFKQLPPIVRSDAEISASRLRRDAFHLSGIAQDLEPTKHPALVRLRAQRRMLPAIADAARHISYGPQGLVDHQDVIERASPDWLSFLPANALNIVDTADLNTWCGRQAGSLSRFNLYSAQISAELAAMAATAISIPDQSAAPQIGIVTPYAAQRRLLSRLIQAMDLSSKVAVGTVHTFQGGEAELIIFDSVLDEPYWTARLCTPNQAREVKRDLNVALTRARSKFVLVGSSAWLNRCAKSTSGLGQLWDYLKDKADLVSARELVEIGLANRVVQSFANSQVIGGAHVPPHIILDENSFFDYFSSDLHKATQSVFGLVPYFGEYRWPRLEPLIRQAIERGVEVTLVTPPPSEAENSSYVEKVIRSLRQLGAVVVSSTGLHGKDIVIDSRIHYTGSLNWASHRGRAEIMHRTENPEYARLVLDFLQAKHIRSAAGSAAHPRCCPHCRGATQVVNQARHMGPWDKQPIKIGCSSYKSSGCKYLVDIDKRAPFLAPPLCEVDHRTRYRRVRRGRGEAWECPKHPKTCERFKVVPGDPEPK